MCLGKLNHFHPEQYIDVVVLWRLQPWIWQCENDFLECVLSKDGVKNNLKSVASRENSAVVTGG